MIARWFCPISQKSSRSIKWWKTDQSAIHVGNSKLMWIAHCIAGSAILLGTWKIGPSGILKAMVMSPYGVAKHGRHCAWQGLVAWAHSLKTTWWGIKLELDRKSGSSERRPDLRRNLARFHWSPLVVGMAWTVPFCSLCTNTPTSLHHTHIHNHYLHSIGHWKTVQEYSRLERHGYTRRFWQDLVAFTDTIERKYYSLYCSMISA